MHHRTTASSFAVAAVVTGLLGSIAGGVAEARPAAFFVKVDGVTPGHVAWIHARPIVSSKRIGFLPWKARHVRSFGCSLENRAGWCRIKSLGTQGWVVNRLLKRDTARRA